MCSTGAGIGQFGRNCVALTQTFAAAGFALGASLAGAGLLQLGFEALDLGLERSRIDLEQQITLFHQAAFIEGYAVDEAGHPWADIHRLRRLQAPGKFIPFIDRLFDHLGDADFRRGHRLFRIRSLAAGAENQ